MTDYCAFVPIVNRPDLLRNIIDTTRPLRDELIVIDNSSDHWAQAELWRRSLMAIRVFTPPVPFSFTQTMNWMIEETVRREKTFCIFMHDDAIIPEGACEKLLELARETDRINPKWGVIFTHYDVLAVINPRAYPDIGGWDTNFAQYYSDNDWYRRLELGGWTKINSGIEVGHGGSLTLNSDPRRRFMNGITFPLYGQYYRQKWGGPPGEEQFIHPFGVLPREWELAGKMS